MAVIEDRDIMEELRGLSASKRKEVLNFIRHLKLQDEEEVLSLSVETAIADFWGGLVMDAGDGLPPADAPGPRPREGRAEPSSGR